MVALAPAPQTIKLQHIGQYFGRTWNNNIYVRYTGSPATAIDLNNMCATAGTNWAAAIAPVCIANVVLQEVTATDLTSNTSAIGSASNLNHAGTLAGPALPVQACAAFSWHVDMRWRGGHGRSYVPAGNVPSVFQGNEWLNTFLTTLRAAALQWHNTFDTLTVNGVATTHVIVRYKHDKGQLFIPALPVIVTATGVDARVDTQRRRLGKAIP